MKYPFVEKCSLLLVFLAACSMNANAVNVGQLECENAFCDEVAEKIDYKHDKLISSFNLRTEHFSLDIPDKAIRRVVASEGDVIVYYEDDQVLIISEMRVPDIEELAEDYAYKLPGIVFTKTSKDFESNALPETLFAKVAILQKQFYFSKASEVVYSEKNDISYFVSDSREMGFSGSALVSTPKIKKVFLKIDSEKMDLKDFKKIVYSVQKNSL